MEVVALHLQSYIDYSRVRGISLQQLTESFPHLELDNLQADRMIRSDDFYQVLAYINGILKDEHLGLKTGRFFNLNALGLIYQISLQAATLAEGIDYLKSFISATLPIVTVNDHIGEMPARLDFRMDGTQSDLNRIILETVLTIVSKELVMMSTADSNIDVSTPHYDDTYPAGFLHGETYTITLCNTQLKSSIRKHGEKHLDYLIPQYLRMLEALKQRESFVNTVKIAALSMATPALPALEEIADAFNLTPRTLQRKLARENITFRQISDDINKQLSLLLLKHKGYSVSDVGYLLGYAEPAAFNHSFKKWYGTHPQSMRT